MLRRLAMLLVVAMLLSVRVDGGEIKYVALTFDDGPSGRFTQRLLEGLEERGVKATFLLCGYRMAEHPDQAKEIFRRGHEIGLHGYSHGDLSVMSYAQAAKELRDTAALLPNGCKPTFLRTPGGAWSKTIAQVAADAGFSLLKWSVDPRDWENHDASAVTAAVVDTVRSGDVILLHDLCDCSVDAALAIVDELQEKGFRFVTVSQLAKIKGIQLEKGKLYCRFQ